MKALIVSDIHANIDALLALEAELRASSYVVDWFWQLPTASITAPAEVISWTREYVRTYVAFCDLWNRSIADTIISFANATPRHSCVVVSFP